ncbi:hypothetical protein WMY93_014005 [Mugilogobius chulae]|uniref:Fibronectin type-III domain-containing protein n=1 Tax=Mugilogobius chulae TaxID=88201 RepID=A0AAW0NXU7_9GOBI
MHSYVFEKDLATHVVTAILYGAQAFFVFDQQVSESENLQDIQGNLQVMIKKIPSISIEGEGALKMEDKDREKVTGESLPGSAQLLGPNGEKAVPVKVWLLPLTSLDSGAAKLVRQISVRLVSEVEKTLEDLVDLEMRCRDTSRHSSGTVTKHQRGVRTKAKLFGDFAEANKDNEDVKFFTVAFTDETHKDSSIYLYEDGFEVSDNFELPSKPEKVSVVDVTQDSVTLLFSAPSCGAEAVTSYRLEHRELREEDGQWQQQSEEKPGSVTVTGLRADTEYVFRVRAVTDVGLGLVAELKPVKTDPEPESLSCGRLAEEVKNSVK